MVWRHMPLKKQLLIDEEIMMTSFDGGYWLALACC